MRRAIDVAALLALAVTLCAGLCLAGSDEKSGEPEKPGVSKNQYAGQSIEEWVGEYAQWAYTTPWTVNPLLDPPGEEMCAVGQHGPVWFLPTFLCSGSPVVIDRTCEVVEGKAILVNLGSLAYGTYCGDPFRATEKEICEYLKSWFQGAIFELEVDGMPVEVGEEPICSGLIDLTLPSENLLDYAGCPPKHGVVYPSMGAGYFVMLKPLPPGKTHTIHWKENWPGVCNGEMTYHITVVEKVMPTAP